MGCFRDALGIRCVRESEGVWGPTLGAPVGNILGTFPREKGHRGRTIGNLADPKGLNSGGVVGTIWEHSYSKQPGSVGINR